MSEYSGETVANVKTAMRKVQEYAWQYAENEARSGATGPQDSLFSGEWADGLTGEKILSHIGQPVMWNDLSDSEQANLEDTFEENYDMAWMELQLQD
jgi:hypothetical protein